MGTDSLYLLVAVHTWYGSNEEDKKYVCEFLRSKDCNDNFVADSFSIFPHAHLVKITRSMKRGSQVFSRKCFVLQEGYVYVAKLFVVTTPTRTNTNSAAIGSKNNPFEAQRWIKFQIPNSYCDETSGTLSDWRLGLFNKVEQDMSRQSRDYHTFTYSELCSRMVFTLLSSISKHLLIFA